MANKMVYCCFDANTEGDIPVNNDIKYFNLFKAWKNNPNIDFDFFNVHEEYKIPKKYLEEDNEAKIKEYLTKRLDITQVFVVIVGEHTANLFKYVRWEIAKALEKNIPIVAINISGENGRDDKYCPAIIRDELVLHVPFDLEKIKTAISIWPQNYKSLKSQGVKGQRILKQ
jgi:hypothetical protein